MRYLLTLAAFCLTFPAMAQQPPQAPPCDKRIKIIYPLANQYLEAPLAEMIDGDGNSIELWANPETGTWTILSTTPGGPTCMVKGGDEFTIIPLEPMGVPS
jgi:hypothetical protein